MAALDRTALRRTLLAAPALVPAAMGIALAFRSGGYSTGSTSLAATELLLAIALWTIVAPAPLAGWSTALRLGLGSLAGLAAWTAASAAWSISPELALPEATRVVLYGAALAFGGLVCADPQRLRVLVGAVVMAMVALCVTALASRTFPDVLTASPGALPGRLSYPLGYSNALGLASAIALILLVHITVADGAHWARALAAAAVPLVVATLVETTSAGAAGAACAGVVLYTAMTRPPALGTVLAVLAIPSGIAVWALQGAPVDAPAPASPPLLGAAHEAGVLLLAAAVAAALLRVGALRLERRAAPLGPVRPRVVLLLLVLVLGAGATTSVVDAGTAIRLDYWRVGADMLRVDPLRGEGAGAFALAWPRDRERQAVARDGHSVLVETAAELGIVGLALLLAAFAALGRGLVQRARSPGADRAQRCVLLAVAAAWLLHAAIDWMWEQPAVTVPVLALTGAALARGAPPAGRGPPTGALARAAAIAACGALAIATGRLALASSDLEGSLRAARHGDCVEAQARARQSLRLRPTSSAHVVLAHCALPSDPRAALAAIDKAAARDPQNWRVHYDKAVVLAALGRDPRPEVGAAHALNLLEPRVNVALHRFATSDPEVWREEARLVPFVLPS